jgi:hypothetical protein
MLGLFEEYLFSSSAPVAKLVDAQDLKSWDSRNGSCRFKSGPGHHFLGLFTLTLHILLLLTPLKIKDPIDLGPGESHETIYLVY